MPDEIILSVAVVENQFSRVRSSSGSQFSNSRNPNLLIVRDIPSKPHQPMASEFDGAVWTEESISPTPEWHSREHFLEGGKVNLWWPAFQGTWMIQLAVDEALHITFCDNMNGEILHLGGPEAPSPLLQEYHNSLIACCRTPSFVSYVFIQWSSVVCKQHCRETQCFIAVQDGGTSAEREYSFLTHSWTILTLSNHLTGWTWH